MKFKPGDDIDSAHCTVLKHEFLRCEDAFNDFVEYGKQMVLRGETRLLSFKTYNAYSRFIHHLYEFLTGAFAREIGSTKQVGWEDAERYIMGHTQRILTNRRNGIQNGTAPVWENDLSYFPEKAPQDFPSQFRRYRNKVIGHVTHERSTLSLSEFYNRYHKYVHMLYWDCLQWWGLRGKEFPDLKEITDFSLLIKQEHADPKSGAT